jgi:hypothetical protein
MGARCTMGAFVPHQEPGDRQAGLEERVGARCPKPSTAESKTAA